MKSKCLHIWIKRETENWSKEMNAYILGSEGMGCSLVNVNTNQLVLYIPAACN